MRIKIWVIGVIILLVFGVFINFIPMVSYYFSSEYQNAKYKGVLQPGSVLKYKLIVGDFLERDEPFKNYTHIMLKFIFDIKINNEENYSISYEIFKFILSINGTKNVGMIDKGITYVNNSNHIISIVLPSSSKVKILNYTLYINNSGFHTFVNKFYGYPICYPLSIYGLYTKYGDQYAAINFGAEFTNEEIHNLLKEIYPKIENYNSDAKVMMVLGLIGGNSIPEQDWGGWFIYGFSNAFPLNIALIIGSFIIAIVYSRRGG